MGSSNSSELSYSFPGGSFLTTEWYCRGIDARMKVGQARFLPPWIKRACIVLSIPSIDDASVEREILISSLFRRGGVTFVPHGMRLRRVVCTHRAMLPKRHLTAPVAHHLKPTQNLGRLAPLMGGSLRITGLPVGILGRWLERRIRLGSNDSNSVDVHDPPRAPCLLKVHQLELRCGESRRLRRAADGS